MRVSHDGRTVTGESRSQADSRWGAFVTLALIFTLALAFATAGVLSWGRSTPAVKAQETVVSPPAAPAVAGTPAAGTPVPVEAVVAEPAGTDGQPDEAATADSDPGNDGERDGKKRDREPRERKDRERPDRNNSNGNGGVSEVIAPPPSVGVPLSYAMPEALRQIPVTLHQQDATDATAGSVGESGTINGEPRERAEPAPEAPSGPGNPAEVILPPSVPGIPSGSAPGIGGTTELAFDAISDTTVFTSSPGSPQSPESVNYLAIGGPQGAVSLVSFEVEGVGEGTVLGARLTFYGAGAAGAPGGSVAVIYDYVVPDGLTANGVPDGDGALNVHGAPSWFERVEPNGLTAVDVTGSVYGDGAITFVMPGQSEATGSIFAMESGSPPQLILTVALPA